MPTTPDRDEGDYAAQGSETMHSAEVDLLTLRAGAAPDPYLQDLIRLADLGVGSIVGLALGGMLVFGRLDSPMAVADVVDRIRRRIVDSMPAPDVVDDDDDGWRTTREDFATYNAQFTRRLLDKRSANNAEARRLGGDPERLPRELAREVLPLHARASVTLTNARIVVASGAPLQVPVMRVRVAQISGWWVVEPDEAKA